MGFWLHSLMLLLLLNCKEAQTLEGFGLGEETQFASVYDNDDAGYLLYCGCMGRFGNQASHFLGVLALAKEINRTLVIPPFISYKTSPITLEPFDRYFNVSVVNQYHRAMTLESFMKTTAAVAWPEHQRHMYCYHFDQTKPVNCRTKQGNPFGPFWDAFHVNFVGDRGIDYGMSPIRWSTELAPQQHPVVAMPGAPARFPVQPEHRELAQYVEWSDSFAAQKQDIVSSMQGPILAAHIRAGADWGNACSGAHGVRSYMSSPQCAHMQTVPHVTQELCFPTAADVASDIAQLISGHGIRTLFFGTDNPQFVANVREQLGDAAANVDIVVSTREPMEDQYVFTQADVFAGNCVSSFSAFAVRHRQAHDKESFFWTLV